jgi:hypothetical protein
MPATHLDTRRAYWRVVKGLPGSLSFGNRYCRACARHRGSRRGPAAWAQSVRSELAYQSSSAEHWLGRWRSHSAPHPRPVARRGHSHAIAVNGKVEHGQVARALLEMELRADGPDVTGPEWWFGTRDLALIPRRSRGTCGSVGVVHKRSPSPKTFHHAPLTSSLSGIHQLADRSCHSMVTESRWRCRSVTLAARKRALSRGQDPLQSWHPYTVAARHLSVPSAIGVVICSGISSRRRELIRVRQRRDHGGSEGY